MHTVELGELIQWNLSSSKRHIKRCSIWYVDMINPRKMNINDLSCSRLISIILAAAEKEEKNGC